MATVTAQTPHAPHPSRRRHPLAAHRAPHVPGRLPIPAQAAAPRGLTYFNALPQDAAEDALRTCCGSRAWAHRLAAHRPYPNLDALLAAADEAAYDLNPGDTAEALACEELPRLSAAAYSAAYTALAAAHGVYEARFGYAFVICLDDIAPGEALDHLLAGLRDRLGNDQEEERVLAAEELRRLARGRITRLVRNLPLARSGTPDTARRDSIGNSPYVPV
ncbi:2-oxo-4-hydroxy-4-carboxy-5-ureidoimidazoline decarboxylase [Streptomyces sp. NPDC102467]|uniref:2-oxo-4-hydroxy-4-carboxy-5-ureidoimidazoline decarboxylase n=1 Tax=Streptomyces sp. NPDC102467 TaxID=3366179 RepID=UPI00381ED871